MPRLNRLLVSAAAAGLLAATAVPALAQVTPQAVMDAGVELSADIQAAGAANGEPPRLSDAVAGPVIRTAFDVSVLEGLAKKELFEIVPVCGGATAPMMGYIVFGLKPEALSDPSPAAAGAAAERMSGNSILYQDEIALALRFGIRCMGTMIPAFERFAGGLPAAERPLMREGLEMSRRGAVQTYTGVFMMASEATTRPANLDLVVDEAVAQADVYALLLNREGRNQLVAVADAHLPLVSDASVRARLRKIRESMSRSDCGMICSL